MKKERILLRRGGALLLALSLLLGCAGCSGLKATTMSLVKREGDVEVRDGDGRDIEPRENLKLYSGYGVETAKGSYAWINLDDVKLVKMDVKSEIEIRKDGGDLEIKLQKGSLFFNITEPLEDDESMTIRTSTMAVGIRGTCGWVDNSDKDSVRVYILEGRVRCKGSGVEAVYVSAGEMAVLDKGAEEIVVAPMTAADIPDFVLEEIEDDDDLAKAILDASGIDVLNPSDPLADALAAYRAVVGQAESYFQDGAYSEFFKPTGVYTYALVRMQAEHEIPALLLEQEIDDYGGERYYAYVFQYDPDSGTVTQPEGTLTAGVASVGGYRGGFDAAKDGNGILETSYYSGSGQGSTSRVTLKGDSLVWTTLWEGNVFEEQDPFAAETVAIEWHNVSDLSGLDGWTPPERTPDGGDQGEPVTAPGQGDQDLAQLLAPYVGTYTPDSSHSKLFGGSKGLLDLEIHADGTITGGWGGRNGANHPNIVSGTPSSVTQKEDGSIEMVFGYSTITVYPPGVTPPRYSSWTFDENKATVEYYDGHNTGVIFCANAADLGG